MSSKDAHGICRLCGEEQELRQSHIIPEFFYTEVYDNLHRLHLMASDSPNKVRYSQKGVRERLLCQSCETQLALWEKYTREVFYGGCEIELKDTGSAVTLRNLDYEKLKLFQLSMLWRLGVAESELFASVTLGRHEERLRSMIRRGDPGKCHDYGCFLLALVDEDGKALDGGVIGQAEKIRTSGHHLYAIVIGSYWWVYVVSSHTETNPFRQYFLQETGEYIISRQLAWENPYIKKLIDGVRKAKQS